MLSIYRQLLYYINHKDSDAIIAQPEKALSSLTFMFPFIESPLGRSSTRETNKNEPADKAKIIAVAKFPYAPSKNEVAIKPTKIPKGVIAALTTNTTTVLIREKSAKNKDTPNANPSNNLWHKTAANKPRKFFISNSAPKLNPLTNALKPSPMKNI